MWKLGMRPRFSEKEYINGIAVAVLKHCAFTQYTVHDSKCSENSGDIQLLVCRWTSKYTIWTGKREYYWRNPKGRILQIPWDGTE
jgi:hypothetical protein